MSTVKKTAPLSDEIVTVVSKLVDDSLETREPSHSEIEFQIKRSGLISGDPKSQGQVVGKAKRVRGTLNWAIENDFEHGQTLVLNLLSLIKSCGGFRDSSPNYVGKDPIINAIQVFKAEGYELSLDGELRPLLLDNLSGMVLTTALEAYVKRAKRGADDAALVTGTGKDLLEATAAHIIVERWGSYSTSDNFPTLLGQAFIALGFATPQDSAKPGELPQRQLERSMYETACAINRLRNKEGTGHGRPWLASVNESEAKLAIEIIGAIAERMLSAYKEIVK